MPLKGLTIVKALLLTSKPNFLNRRQDIYGKNKVCNGRRLDDVTMEVNNFADGIIHTNLSFLLQLLMLIITAAVLSVLT